MARIADFAELLVLDLARRPERPAFVKVARRGGRGGARPGTGRGLGLPRLDPVVRRRQQGGQALRRPRGEPRREGGPEGGRRHHRVRRQAGRHHLRLHREPRPLQARRHRRRRRQARRQRDEAQGHAGQEALRVSERRSTRRAGTSRRPTSQATVRRSRRRVHEEIVRPTLASGDAARGRAGSLGLRAGGRRRPRHRLGLAGVRAIRDRGGFPTLGRGEPGSLAQGGQNPLGPPRAGG